MLKRLAIFGLGIACMVPSVRLLAMQQPPSNAPEQRVAKSSGSSKGQEQPQGQKGDNPAPGAVSASHQPAAPGTDKASEDSRENLQIQRWLMYLTGALVLVGVIQAGSMIWQANLLKQTRMDVKRQADWMQKQAHLMARQGLSMRRQTTLLRKSAEAAEMSARAAMGAESPLLVLHQFDWKCREPFTLEYTRENPVLEISVKNYGRTPAFIKAYEVIFTLEPLPAEPKFNEYPSSYGIDVVEPNCVYLLNEGKVWHRQPLTQEQVQGLLGGTTELTIYGYIRYGDVFGSPDKYLRFSQLLAELPTETEPALFIEWGGKKYTGQDPWPYPESQQAAK
jgi:hypothetical protein